MTPLNPSLLNPGVRATVLVLRALGLDTTDSGDGRTHAHPCDRPYPYVSARVPAAAALLIADRLVSALRGVGVEVVSVTDAFRDGECPAGVCVQISYDPTDPVGAMLDVMGLEDAILPAGAYSLASVGDVTGSGLGSG